LQIKAQGLLNAAKWVSDEYGRDALRDVLHGCGTAVRDRYPSVTAIDWHPAEEFLDFVRVAERHLGAGRPPGRVAEAIGAAGARANAKGTLVRLATWMGRPDALVARATSFWRQFNDEGAMEILELGERVGRFELREMTIQDAMFCAVITGWFREVALAVGAINPLAKHVECKARGEARCVWDVRYARMEPKVPPPKL
jgi:uncharacterized protein (TIGR02265 family)